MKVGRAHRIEESFIDTRSVLVDAMAGAYGIPGKSVHLDTGSENEYDNRTANMSNIRAMFFIPPEENNAFLFCERVANAHLRSAIEKNILIPIGREIGVKFTLDAHVDAEAWSKFFNSSKVYSITAIYRSRRREDINPQRGKSKDLRITVGGAVASRIGQYFSGVLESMTSSSDPVSYDITRHPELRPADETNYEQEVIELEVGDGASKRLIVVERDYLPQFTYVLGDRLSTPDLQQAWSDHALQLLSQEGIRIDP